MMLKPSYTDLMEVVNSGVEEGADPIIQSRYSIVIATAKRARQLIAKEDPSIASASRKPLSVAIDELYSSKVKIVSEDDSSEDDIQFKETGPSHGFMP